jgi:hypothetical protein
MRSLLKPLIFSVASAAALCASPAYASSITLSAPFVTHSVGDTFVIPISISDTLTLGLTSFQFDLAFNPTIVEELSFTDTGTDFETAATSGGGFLTGLTGFPLGSPTNVLSGVADSISGLISGNGLTPGGSLVLVEFKALAPGVSPLTLSNAFLTDNGVPLSSVNGDFTLQDGQICVLPTDCASPPSPVPEPMTVVLLASGLALAAGRRAVKRRRP